jgi:predicted amidohydrolase YtcJ
MAAAITIFQARKIITMNPNCPEATHLAVRDGRILGVGELDDLTGWGDYTLDRQFTDKILMPGFVEGHCHAMDGLWWALPYVGFHARRAPDGRLHEGLDSIDAVVTRLQQAERQLSDPHATLFAWGFDPIYFDGPRMVAADLDRVSTTRPIVLMHSNGHLINVNSLVLQRAGIDRHTNVAGIAKDANGEPTGELQEQAAKYMAFRVAGKMQGDMNEAAMRRFSAVANQTGVTTATDLHAQIDPVTETCYREVTAMDDYPLRLVPAVATVTMSAAEGIELVQRLRRQSTDKLIYGLCKIMTDGSIQGFTARLRWPGYYNGAPNGVWNLAPEELTAMVADYHAAGLQMHMHVNGDEAIELMLDAVQAAQSRYYQADHRHTLQHCQMADEAQFKRMKALGMCANLFANHIYYWGEQHRALTMGPDRAGRMDACATALREGVALGIHCDAPVTPLAPLFTAWCAVNRLTSAGRVLGPQERITVAQALYAITLGAAYTLKLDHRVGSIASGKLADFAVLEEDPLAVPAESLKDIPVWGTVVGGRTFAAGSAA